MANEEENWKLLKAAQVGDVVAIAACIARGADVNNSSDIEVDAPLAVAAASGKAEAARVLLGAGANVNQGTKYFGYTALMSAAQRGHENVARSLVDAGATPMQCGWITDPFGITWQIVPRRLQELLSDPDREAAGRATQAMLTMSKIDVAALEAAFRGDA